MASYYARMMLSALVGQEKEAMLAEKVLFLYL
jgi:hypothetical protein